MRPAWLALPLDGCPHRLPLGPEAPPLLLLGCDDFPHGFPQWCKRAHLGSCWNAGGRVNKQPPPKLCSIIL